MKGVKVFQPAEVGVVHFIGIGGIGMSGIAMVMHVLGYRVQGSDQMDSDATRRLQAAGVKVFIGHHAKNMDQVNAVVASTAIDESNPEVMVARQQSIPVMQRAEMLAELMRFKYGIAIAGTHGKTTVTSLVTHILIEAEVDPTYVIGGCIKCSGQSAGLGVSDYWVAEADESDGSFLHMRPIIAVITNIDSDHLSSYDNKFDNLKETFAKFIGQVPFYGLAIVCGDDHNLNILRARISRRFLTYGLGAECDVRATNVAYKNRMTTFDAVAPWRDDCMAMRLHLPGSHNILNALAAVSVCHELGVSDAVIQKALESFEGIERRFNIYPDLTVDKRVVHVVDDYGHHPTEIIATLEAADKVWPTARKVVVFQPHRYTRTEHLFKQFIEALKGVDVLLLLDVYAAGEEPIAGVDSRAIANAIRTQGSATPIEVEDVMEVPHVLRSVVQTNDVVIVMGAGSVGRMVPKLVEDWGHAE